MSHLRLQYRQYVYTRKYLSITNEYESKRRCCRCGQSIDTNTTKEIRSTCENLLILFLVPPSRLRLSPTPQLPVADGTSVLFNCTSERAYPIPTFEWYKNDKLIQRYRSLIIYYSCFYHNRIFIFVSSIGINNNNQTSPTSFSSSSILKLLLSPADHDHMLRCQVTNEATQHDTNVELKLDVLCESYTFIKSYLTILFDHSTDTNCFCLVKPIISISWNQKELPTTLTVIENTFEIIHCVISANPSAIANIEWLKNDQLIRGKNSCETYSHAFDICTHVRHIRISFSFN